MIQKIERIKNVGNYEDYLASGDTSFKKMTIIYAENGAGKTTLARILHSLSQDEPTIIQNHRRIGSASLPEINIRTSSGNIIFNGHKWNIPMEHIIVFDAHFVSDNVYTGFQISNDHKKHLYKFVLGDAGVETAKKIERVKQLIESKNSEIASVLAQIQAYCKISDVESILKIKPQPAIDQLIQEKEKELKISLDNKAILIHSLLIRLNPINVNIDYNSLRTLFSLTIEDIGQEYLDIVNQHILCLEEHNMPNVSNWLLEGIKIISNPEFENCPFCGQSIKQNKLIEGYNQYFSKRYKNIVNEIDNFIIALAQHNVQQNIDNIISSYKLLVESHAFWDNYMQAKSIIPILEFDFEKLIASYNQLKDTLLVKKTTPIVAIPVDIINDYCNREALLMEKINIINNFVLSYNDRINNLKGKIRPEADVEKELKQLNLIKNRFQQPLLNLCNRVILLKKQLSRLQSINKALQQQQKNISNEIVRQYGEKTNYYLRDVFQTKFQILEIKDGGIRGRAKESNLSYTLTFNGTPIEPEGTTHTSFKNVLSEGDKNTIAFSFFLAKLTTEDGLSNKIVVFDDPLTSLDLNRRNKTIHQLVILYPQVTQSIILSHNLHFLIELNGNSRIKKCDKKSLQIFNANGVSRILEYDIKKDWLDNYQKALESMESFLNNPSPDNQETAINSIRVSLETFLKLKYCRYISNHDDTFGTIISNLEKSSCSFINSNKSDVIDKLNQLLSISWRGHHGTVEEKDVYSEVDLSTAEALGYVRMAMNLLNSEL